MITFVQLPLKRPEAALGLRSLVIGFTAGLLFFGQLGLLVWALIR